MTELSLNIPGNSSVESGPPHGPQEGLPALTLGALGVVFGDIGTSPLYALKESFIGHHRLAVEPANIFGVLSLMFWTMMIIVTFKYVLIILRADNKGEGGTLALMALVMRRAGQRRWTRTLVMLGIIATALFCGDAIITPAISVLSAVEGLTVVNDGFGHYVIPVSIVVLIGLFAIQRSGTARVGVLFGPIMVIYFLVIALLGLGSIFQHPEITGIVNPIWAARFFLINPTLAFLALGSVVLAVTGAEALYADMGHFGRRAIKLSWIFIALPCLLLNYMGQGALLLAQPAAVENPFYMLAPESARLPLVILATIATVIASQAVISGAYSVAQQAIQLGFLPRMQIHHTSEKAHGQIYVPTLNRILLILVILLVLGFGNSSNLAGAYGIAVTGTMFITAILLGILTWTVWRWNPLVSIGVTGAFLIVDGAYFASNLTKIPDGGWFPLLVAGIAFLMLTTWGTGRRLMRERLAEGAMPLELFVQSAAKSIKRVQGTSVFLSATAEGVPSALLHNVKHNKVLHERVVILTMVTEQIPHVAESSRVAVVPIGEGLYRLFLHYGFMDEVDVPRALAQVDQCGKPFVVMETSFFLSRETLIPSERPGMMLWREHLFAWMMRNAVSAMEFFKLPTNRVIELGSQVEI